LLLTDVVMPQMSGPALVEEVIKLFPDISILYMSGYTDRLGSYGVEMQELPFLQKPFSPEVLASKVREVLKAGKSSRLARAKLLLSKDTAKPELVNS
jgi:DNA-binding NtrC family response regulator